MRLENLMIKRKNQHHRKTGRLKLLLLTASVIATIGGARLLDLQETVEANTSTQTITIVDPAVGSAFSTAPQSNRKMAIELRPIPQVVAPHLNPVARARSSM